MRRTSPLLIAACLLVACGSDTARTPELYANTAVPAVPDRTSPIDPSWVEGSGETLGTDVADGTYWAEQVGVGESDDRFVNFDLSQALFGPTCTAELGADACTDDYGVISEPHGELPAFVADLSIVSVVGDDKKNYSISAAELHSLAGGNAPDARAPDGYSYTPFPFLLTLRSGKVVAAHQIWTP